MSADNESILNMLSLLCDKPQNHIIPLFLLETRTQPNTHIPCLHLTLIQLVPCFSVEWFRGRWKASFSRVLFRKYWGSYMPSDWIVGVTLWRRWIDLLSWAVNSLERTGLVSVLHLIPFGFTWLCSSVCRVSSFEWPLHTLLCRH